LCCPKKLLPKISQLPTPVNKKKWVKKWGREKWGEKWGQSPFILVLP
jgi:hypothetical protein